MAEKANNHWIPQHHLRLFSDGRRFIHLVSRDSSLIVEGASVKNQCSRHKFYRDVETENRLQELETSHAGVYRAAQQIATGARDEPLRTAENSRLRHALLLQHARTPRYAQVHAHAGDQMALYTYHEHLSSLPPTPRVTATMRAIEEGKASLRGSKARSIANGLDFAARLAPFVADLRLLILHNQTDFPLVLGDAACLFCNQYMRDVDYVGVLGLSTRGLMITMPIDSRSAVLLFDKAVYRAARYEYDRVDLADPHDVEMLNALQVYGAQHCIYFADSSLSPRMQDFVVDRPPNRDDHRASFDVLRPAGPMDGQSSRSELLHTFERQLPVCLDLSFITTRARPPKLNIESPRRLKLFDNAEQNYAPHGLQPLGIDELVRWVESELVVSDGT